MKLILFSALVIIIIGCIVEAKNFLDGIRLQAQESDELSSREDPDSEKKKDNATFSLNFNIIAADHDSSGVIMKAEDNDNNPSSINAIKQGCIGTTTEEGRNNGDNLWTTMADHRERTGTPFEEDCETSNPPPTLISSKDSC